MNNYNHIKTEDKTQLKGVSANQENKKDHTFDQSINGVLEKTFNEAKKIISNSPVSNEKSQATNLPKQKANNSITNQPINRYARPAYRRFPVGHVSGILLTVFGIIGMVAFSIPALILALIKVATTVSTVFTALVFIFFYLKLKGDTIRKRLKRYQNYVRIINNRSSCSLKELSTGSHQKEKYIYKDLKQMIKIGMFPDGNFNSNKTVIMLTREKYTAYLKRQDELEKEMKIKKSENESSYSKEKIEIQNDWPSIHRVGEAYVKEINTLKHSIVSESLVEDIYRTEILTIKILEVAQEKSKDPNDVRRLINYYLPETIQLLKTFKSLENQPVQGMHIKASQDEIAAGLKMINDAFELLFDSLFEEEALNISTDISVLNTVFTQNGLVEDDINFNSKGD